MPGKDHDVVQRSPRRSGPRARVSARALSIVVLVVASGCAAPPLPPVNSDLPAGLRVYPGAILDDVLTARGQAVYECNRGSTGLSWDFQGVESALADSTGKRIGTATPGGYFMADDGSYVVTRVDATASMGQDKLPWARLVARLDAGRQTGEGRFGRTQLIQRVSTKGGVAPDGACAVEGAMLYVPYDATYLVYRAPAASQTATPQSGAGAVQPAALSAKALSPPVR